MIKIKKNDWLIYIIVVIGVIIAYISFFYAASCYAAYKNAIQDIQRLSADKTEKALYFEYEGSNSWITDVFCDENVSTYFTGVTLHFDKGRYEALTTVYIQPPAKSPVRLVSGRWPDADCKGNVAVLGKKRKSSTYTRDGQDYISICGDEYRVTGYVSEEKSGVADYLVMLFWNQCGDNVKDAIDYFAGTPMQVCVVVECSDMEVWYDEHLEILNEYADHVRLSDNYIDSYVVENKGYYLQLAYLLYAFSVIILVIIVQYWISVHTEELVIRRIVGYERYQLLRYVGGKLCSVLIYISFPCFLIQMILNYIGEFSMNVDWGWTQVVWAICFLAITFIVLLIYPMYKILIKDIISDKKPYS